MNKDVPTQSNVNQHSQRVYRSDIMKEIKDRWSPRAFSDEPIDTQEVMALIEAARFAPSCFNEQPWRFLIANKKETLEAMRDVLMPGNLVWAAKAPVLVMILSARTFSENGKENRWHAFDAGTAWGYLSLEAQRRGLITHAMGGFSVPKARERFGISDEWNILSVVAIGRYGDPKDLNESLRNEEFPKARKETAELLLEPR